MKLQQKVNKVKSEIEKRLYKLSADCLNEGFLLQGVSVSVMTHRTIGQPADGQIIDVEFNVRLNKP